LQDASSSDQIVASAGRADLAWLESTSDADNVSLLYTKVLLTSICHCVGEVFLGTLGTCIYPGLGTDIGETLGIAGFAALLV